MGVVEELRCGIPSLGDATLAGEGTLATKELEELLIAATADEPGKVEHKYSKLSMLPSKKTLPGWLNDDLECECPVLDFRIFVTLPVN